MQCLGLSIGGLGLRDPEISPMPPGRDMGFGIPAMSIYNNMHAKRLHF